MSASRYQMLRRRPLAATALLLIAACTQPAPRDRQLLTLVDQPETRGEHRRCVSDGPREWAAELRRPTYCLVYFRDGISVWRRDAAGHISKAYRSWMWGIRDSLLWQATRDSVLTAAQSRAGDVTPCAGAERFGIGGRRTVWGLADYDLEVETFEPAPGGAPGFRLSVGVRPPELALCQPRARPPA